ncbi:LamG-like jellyroll fold domain-containing protein [Actinotalea sp. C106]|uniref:LamG-like jellyroll fold domain-containing protein n=1 Tax=Actinotalea sp. C106 TaxID=2908644 RepID=UPI0020285D42|nr:LamG-like jellyroll fold domain-containing protein [Actinotalea sp. C106]
MTEVPTLDEAAALAVECGHDVAAIESYDPWSALVATPESTVREDLSAGAVRTDITGDWAPVDPTVVVDPASGELRVASPLYDITLDPTDAEGFLSIEAGGSTISMDVPVELGTPAIDGASVSWPLLDGSGTPIDGAVLTTQVHPDASGVTPVIEVEDPEAYAELTRAAEGGEVAFEISASEDLVLDVAPETGGFEAVDAETGDMVFAGGEALQWDSSGVVEPGTDDLDADALSTDESSADEAVPFGDLAPPLQAGDLVASLEVEAAADQTLLVKADEEMIVDPETTWPIAIDPPVSGVTRHEWTVIRTAYGPKYKTTAHEGVGLCLRSGGCDADFRSRMLWEFTGMSTLKSLAAADVIEASFSAYGTHSYNCAGESLELHLMSSGISSVTTWGNQPASRMKLATRYPNHRPGQCGGLSWVEWDATAGAKAVAGTSSTMVLELKSPTESSMTSWRRYYLHNAKLSIEYNRAPTRPSSMKLTVGTTVESCVTGADRPYIASTTPKLSVVAKDPDGQNAAVTFQVYQGSTSKWSSTTAGQGSGATHTKTVSAGTLSSATYRWRARSKDSSGRYSAYTGWCEFTVDITKPAAPKVSAVKPSGPNSNIKAVYATDVETGGKGLTGCFKFSGGGSSDVKHFEYSFNATTYGSTAKLAADGTSTVCTPSGHPLTTGTNFIAVRSEDKAGNISASTRYTYEVATAREDGIWTFDSNENPAPDESFKDDGEADPAGDLKISGATWVEGPHTLFDSRLEDWALDFDGVNDAAATESPVFDTTSSFVMSAHVRLETGDVVRTALSQDGAWTNTWSVGYRPSGCEITGWTGGCWAFVLHTSDGGVARTVYSTVRPRLNEWTHLTAEYDASENKARLWVCDIGTPEAPAAGEPVLAQANAPSPMWQAPGPVVIGRGQVDGLRTDRWDGQIDNVRLFKGEVVADAKVRRMCQGAEANDFTTGETALDPTTTAGQ